MNKPYVGAEVLAKEAQFQQQRLDWLVEQERQRQIKLINDKSGKCGKFASK